MTRLLTTLSLILAVLIGSTGVSYALPICTGSPADESSDVNKNWTDCFGRLNHDSGSKYVGEWKDGKKHGQGTYTSATGAVKEGVWKVGEFQYEKTIPKR